MSMVFWMGYNLGDFLIPGLTVNSVGSFAIVAAFSFLLAVAVEGMKVVLAKVEGAYISSLLMNGFSSSSFYESDVLMQTSIASRAYQGFPLVLLYGLNLIMVYVIMLVVMQFNVYLFLAVILGSVCGYFLFSITLTRVRLHYQYLNSQHINNIHRRLDQGDGSTPPLLANQDSSPAPNLYSCHNEDVAHNYAVNNQVREDSPEGNYSTNAMSAGKNCGRGKKSSVKSNEQGLSNVVKHNLTSDVTPLKDRTVAENVSKQGETSCKKMDTQNIMHPEVHI